MCSGGRKGICSLSRRSSPGQVHYLSKVLDFMQLPQLPSKNPRVLRLRGKHARIQGKKKKKRNNLHIHTHGQTVFFPVCFHRLKCETWHMFSSQVTFKWRGMVSRQEKNNTKTKKNRGMRWLQNKMQSRFKVRDNGWQRPDTHTQIAQRETVVTMTT